MLEKLKDYLENEYRSVVNLLTREKLYWCVDNPNEIKHLALQRGLGACLFIQYLGISFKEVDKAYKTFKEAVEAVVPTIEREEK